MRPSPVLQGRLKARLGFTTKDVARGFYRGKGVGSLGAHTDTGRYLIDYRKTRHFVVPNLAECHLTPYVTPETQRKYTHPGYIAKDERPPPYTNVTPITVNSVLYSWFEHGAEIVAEVESDINAGLMERREVVPEVFDEDVYESLEPEQKANSEQKSQP